MPKTPYDPLSRPWTWWQTTALVLLRFAIGWHLFYEGVSKLQNPYWTSAGYLDAARGFASEWFEWLALDPGRLALVDGLNKWGLVLIGLALMLGILTRTATVLAIVLLALYYLAAPAWVGFDYAFPQEGAYVIINKNIIEILALFVTLAFPTGRLVGLDRLLWWARNPAPTAAPAERYA
jgi:thiosulfate dehydrogenase [quinone] large subunit